MDKNLYVGNLSYEVTNSDLEQLLGPHGEVLTAEVIMDRDSGRSKGFVERSSENEAQAAITALNGTEHGGRSLTVNEAKHHKPRSGGFGGAGRVGDSGGRGGNRY